MCRLCRSDELPFGRDYGVRTRSPFTMGNASLVVEDAV